MKKFRSTFRVSRALLAIALVPAALATTSLARAEIQSSLLALESTSAPAAPSATGPTASPAGKRAAHPDVSALLEAAGKGHGPAQRELGAIYDKGAPGTPRDFAESMRWYQKAREQGEVIPYPHTLRAIPYP